MEGQYVVAITDNERRVQVTKTIGNFSSMSHSYSAYPVDHAKCHTKVQKKSVMLGIYHKHSY